MPKKIQYLDCLQVTTRQLKTCRENFAYNTICFHHKLLDKWNNCNLKDNPRVQTQEYNNYSNRRPEIIGVVREDPLKNLIKLQNLIHKFPYKKFKVKKEHQYK